MRIKYLKPQASKLLQLFLYGLLCVFVGALCSLFIMQVYIVDNLQDQVHQTEQDLFRCADVLHLYTSDRDTIMRQFADMESRFTRMEHLMHIPRSERHGAWKEMVEDQ